MRGTKNTEGKKFAVQGFSVTIEELLRSGGTHIWHMHKVEEAFQQKKIYA